MHSPAAGPSATGVERRPASRRLLVILPLALFAAIAVAFALGLNRKPDVLPSALIGKPVPVFSLPPVQGRVAGLSNRDLMGEVSIVNFFASWCVPCWAEAPLFMQLAATGVVPIHGINYKDRPQDAAAWLDKVGDPYTRTGADLDGRVGIDWGVYGLPETFVIDRDGKIVHKHIGVITERDLDDTILPLVRRLQAEAGGSGQ